MTTRWTKRTSINTESPPACSLLPIETWPKIYPLNTSPIANFLWKGTCTKQTCPDPFCVGCYQLFFCSGALKSLEHWEFIKYHKLLLKIAFFALYSLLIEIDGKRWCWRDTVTVGTVPQCGPHSVVTVGAVRRLMPVLASQPQLMPRTMTSLSQLLFQHFKAKFLFFSLESTVIRTICTS